MKHSNQELLERINKLKAIVSQMERHGNLNQSDMPLVCNVLLLEIYSLTSLLETMEDQNDTD